VNKLFPLTLAALSLTAPASAQIAAFQHIILVIQENRTPDNLFQGLCTTPSACSTAPSSKQYNIELSTQPWLDKSAPGGTILPHSVPLGVGYDNSHSHSAFVAQCDLNASGMCAMDGHATCSPKADPCPPNASYGFVDNSTGTVQPYLDIAKNYGFANYMFATQQGPSYPAHQFLFGATSAPSTDDDHAGNFVVQGPARANLAVGCTALPTTTVPVINAQGHVFEQVKPCFERQTLADLLDTKGVSWRYYGEDVSDTWRNSKPTGTWMAPNSIAHICGAVNGKCTGVEWTSHLEFAPFKVLSDIAAPACKLSGVSWVIPDSFDSDHSWDVRNTGGPSWVAQIVNAVGKSGCTDNIGGKVYSYWQDTAIIVTWDDWGGWYDHVPPHIEGFPQGGFQMGFRVPLLFVSAYTPAGYIGNKSENFGSMIRFAEKNFGIPEGALTFADQRAQSDLTGYYNLNMPPRAFVPINAPLSAAHFLARKMSGLPVDDDLQDDQQ
jgi:phospholipase C